MFLASQGVTALVNLVLSCRVSLLLNVRSTVPANDVARFVVLTSPRLLAFFPSPLLDSALNLVRAASTAALVHRTLHPQLIPWISSAGPSRARSSSTSFADRGVASPVVPPLQ